MSRLPERRGIGHWHPSIRLRLALNYAGLFLLASCALLGLNYLLLYNGLYSPLSSFQLPTLDKSAMDVQRLGALPASVSHDIMVSEQAVRDELRHDLLVHAAGTSAIALGVIGLLGLAVAWLLAGRMLRPLTTLTSTARRISEERLNERIGLTGPDDEVKVLADTFDAMVARLETAFANERRFVADASHELRTSLAIARTSVEVVLAKPKQTDEQWRSMAARVLNATSRAERLLDGLLALARSDQGLRVHEPHDLAMAAAQALNQADPEAAAADLDLHTDLRPAPVAGDPALLDRLVANLVDNAVRHNRPAGWLRVVSGRRAGSAFVEVSNSGEVVAGPDVDRLFEPFTRLGPDGGRADRGSGLGLAIVRSIVLAHHGTVTVAPVPDGGLVVTVEIPARLDELNATP